jgi:hypothetical protein
MFASKAKAYPSEVAPSQKLAMDKHSSLLNTLQNYGRKKFYKMERRFDDVCLTVCRQFKSGRRGIMYADKNNGQNMFINSDLLK